MTDGSSRLAVPPYPRGGKLAAGGYWRIGEGEQLGGKGLGLWKLRYALAEAFPHVRFPGALVTIPALAVLPAEVFARFMERNDLWPLAAERHPDAHVARRFQQASLPAEIVGDLKGLIDGAFTPLAVRSSSLLEDSLGQPFAGIYATKMIPNNQASPEERFRRLVEAIKFVYASPFFQAAMDYRDALHVPLRQEGMAVLIQEVVGRRHGHRFYPDVSGVGRSFHYYPTGPARRSDGVIQLALGLGKTIVDGELAWTYSPAHPRVPPPAASVRDLIRQTQSRFWVISMDRPREYDPLKETEYLLHLPIAAAEEDTVLPLLVSTYDREGDRLIPGMGTPGPRALTFAPVLDIGLTSLPDLLATAVATCRALLGGEVEIEFALTWDGTTGDHLQLGLLQMRPMAGSTESVTLPALEPGTPSVLTASTRVLGNGRISGICDIVCVWPDQFDAAKTPLAAEAIAGFNRELMAAGRPYLLIGFGRIGSSDPWLGIPVQWGEIAGAAVIVEGPGPGMTSIDPSQGSHFFHNLCNLRVLYFTLDPTLGETIDWEWLATRQVLAERNSVRHIRLASPLQVLADGASGRGVIIK